MCIELKIFRPVNIIISLSAEVNKDEQVLGEVDSHAGFAQLKSNQKQRHATASKQKAVQGYDHRRAERACRGKENIPPGEAYSIAPVDKKRSDRPPLGSLFAATQTQPSRVLFNGSSSFQNSAQDQARHESQIHEKENRLHTAQKDFQKPSVTHSINRQMLSPSSKIEAPNGLLKQKRTSRQHALESANLQEPKRPSSIQSMFSSAAQKSGHDKSHSKEAAKNDSKPQEGKQKARISKPLAASSDVEPLFDVTQMETESEMHRNIQARMRRHHAKRARLRR